VQSGDGASGGQKSSEAVLRRHLGAVGSPGASARSPATGASSVARWGHTWRLQPTVGPPKGTRNRRMWP